MSTVSPEERSRRLLLLALFLVTMIAAIAIYCWKRQIGRSRRPPFKTLGKDRNRWTTRRSILMAIGIFCGGCTIGSCSESPFTQQDGTRLVVTCRYSGSFCRMPSQVGTIQGTKKFV
jgi:hypothetical protein